jgi:hypothetical protein
MTPEFDWVNTLVCAIGIALAVEPLWSKLHHRIPDMFRRGQPRSLQARVEHPRLKHRGHSISVAASRGAKLS